jgi:diguanylate cyclase (GGDEF)-like protein/PAS domain S-box-containing protein
MNPNKLSEFSGEYLDRRMEEAFRAERFGESHRHARMALVVSIILNSLFFISDWRFQGDPHFFVAIPARAAVVAVSMVCLLLVTRISTHASMQRALILWQLVTAVSIGFLVSAHTDIALFVVIMLPAIFYLVVPAGFRVTLMGGIGCSICMLAGYVLPHGIDASTTGLVLAMVVMNASLILVVIKGNRLRRLEWSATLAERRANAELAASRKVLEKIFMAVPIPLVVTERSTSRLIQANHAAMHYFGGVTARAAEDALEDIYADPGQRSEFLRRLDAEGQVSNYEVAIKLADGTRRDVLLAGSAVQLEGVACVITGAIDISARKAMEARLENLATKDPLTQVSNRTEFFEAAEREMARAAVHGHPVCVVMMDLDYFKLINDAFGHAAGDLTLKAFADLCRACVRDHDHLARLGGEEFALLLPGTPRGEALAISERLRIAVENMKVEGAPTGLRVTVSVGVAEIDCSEGDVHLALARADLALYGAKMRGRNKVVDASETESGLDFVPIAAAQRQARFA